MMRSIRSPLSATTFSPAASPLLLETGMVIEIRFGEHGGRELDLLLSRQ